ncbi:MAG TPA: phosphoribosyltransferase family protein [Alphaproteobacteria bacterium]|nr:phosphoribosyltransferase family protein [Alphaproteobacteria bacterium]
MFPEGRSRLRDRLEAGRLLAERLEHLRDRRPVVLALPRGGVPVGYEIAQRLEAPLDILLVRKIGAPEQPELAVGAVVDGPETHTLVNDRVVEDLGVTDEYIAEARDRGMEEIERRRQLFAAGRPPIDLKGRTVIMVDDGIATGATVRASIAALRMQLPAHVVLAVPVAPAETALALAAECDELVILAKPDQFHAVSAYYQDFRQLDDEDVIHWLKRLPAQVLDEEPEAPVAAPMA